MLFRSKLEDPIADEFAERHPDLEVVKPTHLLYRHPDVPWAVCSPDRLVVVSITEVGDALLPLELKADDSRGMCDCGCGQPLWGAPGSDEIPHHYRMQLLWQCSIFGAPRGYLARYSGKRQVDYVVEMDATGRQDILRCMGAAEKFLADLRDDRQPSIDDTEATTRALMMVHANVKDGTAVELPDHLIYSYELLKEQERALAHEWTLLENRIRQHMQDATAAMVTLVIAEQVSFASPALPPPWSKRPLPSLGSQMNCSSVAAKVATTSLSSP